MVTTSTTSSHVGTSVRIDWKQPGLAARLPVYLMIAADAPVRFSGTGFYVLTPGAEAPFKTQSFAGRTRVIIPLYGKGAALKGTIDLVPLAPGATNLSWDVVGHSRCGEHSAPADKQNISLSVSAGGRPSLIIGDPFKPTGNARTFASADRTRLIEIEEGRYRLLDASSGAEIAERAAKDPRFSPTGRFVGAEEQDGFIILDTIDGAPVGKISIMNVADIAWDHADSFVVGGGPQAGYMQAINTLNSSARTYGGSWLAARCCSAVDDAAYRIDLENNLAVFSGPLGVIVDSLRNQSVSFAETMKINGEIKTARVQALRFASETSAVRPFALPKRWESRGRLVFSHLGLPPPAERAPSEKALARFLLEPNPWTGPSVASLASARTSTDQVSRSAWSDPNSAALELGQTRVDRFVKQLGEFGFSFLHVQTPNQTLGKFAAGNELPRPEANRVFAQIGSDMPAVRSQLNYIETNGMRCKTDAPDGLNTNINVARRWASGTGRGVWLTWLGCAEGNAAFNSPNLYVFDTKRKGAFRFDTSNGNHLLENDASSVAPACDYTVDSCLANAELQGDRYIVLTSHEGQAYAIFDLEEQKVVAKRFNLSRGRMLSRILMAADVKYVTQINSDGTFFVYRLAGGAQVLAGRVFDDEVVVALPDGRFDATPEGAEMMRLRFPGRSGEHALAQFRSKLHFPGLLAKAMSDKPAETPVAVGVPPQLTAKITREGDGMIRLEAKVDGAAGASSVRVYHDGVLTTEHAYPQGGPLLSHFAPLPGARWISVLAVDADGVVSAPVGRDIGDARDTQRRIRIIAAGINQYDDTRIQSLEAPRRDAEAFVKAIKGLSHAGNATSTLLPDREASPARIKAALAAEIEASGPGDTVMLFFAGHGVRDGSGRLYLATSGTRIDDMPGTALNWDELAAILNRAKGRVSIFLDTCHSGAAGTGFFATNDATAGSLLAKMQSNIVIFSASKGRELALETQDGGMFTRALVDVIGPERTAHDLNRNGVIEMSELYRGVKSKVRAMTNGQQTPWFARNQMVGDFALF